MKRVAILTDDPGWHGRRLLRAFARHGVRAAYSTLTGAVLQLDGQPRVSLPGFTRTLPDAVLVRGVPGGSLEQIVHYLNVLHVLQELGVPVYNDGRAIERAVDKSLTTLRLRAAGLPTPDTWVCAQPAQAQALVRQHASPGRPLVCKPLFGSQGRGVVPVSGVADLPAAAEGGVWYLQRLIVSDAPAGMVSDWRVFVIAGRAVAAMRRTAPGLLANVAQGARCDAALAEGPAAALAEAAVRCLDIAYAGVDVMRDSAGQWWLIEVNSVPAWKGLQGVTGVDIADALVRDLLQRCAVVPTAAEAPAEAAS